MTQHPYAASVPASEQHNLQQSLFPSWHNRRHSHTTDMILEEGQRKSGSFEALQDMVQKYQPQQDDSDDDEKHKEDVHVKATANKNDKTTPPGPSILIQEPDQDDAADDKKQPKLRRSVKFNVGEDDGSNFIKN